MQLSATGVHFGTTNEVMIFITVQNLVGVAANEGLNIFFVFGLKCLFWVCFVGENGGK